MARELERERLQPVVAHVEKVELRQLRQHARKRRELIVGQIERLERRQGSEHAIRWEARQPGGRGVDVGGAVGPAIVDLR
eukprot:2359773-Prymnesium_polylepis.2